MDLRNVSKLSLSPSAEMTTNEITLSVPDWSLLPVELLHIISKKLEDCFNVVHARSVCTSWRSIFLFPSHLSRQSYSLPTLDNKGSWSLEKIPLFLFRNRTLAAEYFVGGIGRNEPEEDLPSPNQCSVKVEIPGSDPRLMNILDCQILPLRHQYRMIGCNAKGYRGVAVLPLNKEGGGDFVVLLNCTSGLMVLRNNEMRWRRFQTLSMHPCDDLVTFRGRFYALFVDGDVFGFDPHFLELYPLVRLKLDRKCGWSTSLVPSGDDELFLVELFSTRRNGDVLDLMSRVTLRVCRLDVDAGQWVMVKDVGDRVLVIGDLGNVSFSAKELPDGCGVSGNSVVFTYGPSNVTCSYRYDDDLNCWRYKREDLVTILGRSPAVALRVERSSADAYSHRSSWPHTRRSVNFRM
ncbi:F-box/kelch-repeat protein At1g64840-like [Raphanus sativus]|uniref:F-box/kelch-repeat protein At1g64840-like n=1 Tax=Raphanus sativus TaxID=3726 RepID=A0A9W3DLB3_RAPSA|nr:F-box/kelch-repeat protein At1g64840-like [Raphanus sativus]